MSTLLSVLPLLVAAGLTAGPAKKPAAPPTPRPTPVTRTLSVTEANAREVFPLHVAAGEATWLLLPAPLERADAFPPELGAVQQQGEVLIFTPATALPAEKRVPLLLSFAGGGPPLIFEVQAASASFDHRVTVERRLGALAPKDSPEVLGDRLQQCKDELQELRTGAAALEVLTAIVADTAKGKQPALVRRPLNAARKQNFIYVKLQETYRLFDWTFVTLDLENRQGGTLWVLGDASVRQMGVDAPLPTSVRHERPAGLKGGESERVVVGFATPADNTRKLSITLTDKAGTRNVALEDLDL